MQEQKQEQRQIRGSFAALRMTTKNRQRQNQKQTEKQRHRQEKVLAAFGEGDEGDVFGAGVVGAGADDLAVGALLHYVGGPAARAGDGEDGGEHRGGDSHGVIRGGG